MADINDGDILRIAAVQIFDSADEIVNVWHAKVTAGAPMAFSDADVDIQEYMDDLYAHIASELHQNMVADYLSVHNVTTDAVFGTLDWGTYTGGSDTSPPLPTGVACFGWIRTRKPRVQMRKYFGVFGEGNLDSGAWSVAVTGSVGDVMALHMGQDVMTEGLGLTGVAYNRTTKVATEGVSFAVRAEPAYQRRRKRGVGS